MNFKKNEIFKPFKLIFIVTINLSLLPVPVGIGIFSAELLHQSFNINKKTFGKFKEEPGKRISNQLNFPKVIKHQLLYRSLKDKSNKAVFYLFAICSYVS